MNSVDPYGFINRQSREWASLIGQPLKGFLYTSDFGARGDGITDDRRALSGADTAANGREIAVPPGVYKVDSNITIASPLYFMAGAKLKPASGVTITLGKPPVAPISQIFDLSAGGTIALSVTTCDVWADWWGAVADNATDNDTFIQGAIDAVEATTSGGNVHFTTGTYQIGSVITITNNVVLKGRGRWTEFKATSGFTDTSMFNFENAAGGGTSQFNCRMEDCQVHGNGKDFSTGAIQANSWNEQCGLRNVTVRELDGGKGIFVRNFYGGAATWEINGCEVFTTTAPDVGTVCIQVTAPDGLTGWVGGLIRHTICAGDTDDAANVTGIQIDNDVVMELSGIHFEDMAAGLVLQDEATVNISGKFTGGAGVTDLISITSGWIGTLTAARGTVKQGNATNLLVDNRAAGVTVYNTDPLMGFLAFPPDPGLPLATARVTGGATPVITGGNAYAVGISGVSRNAAGSYRLTLDPAFTNTQSVNAWVTNYSTSNAMVRINQQTASTFDVVFVDHANAAIEIDDFQVWVAHKR